MRKALTPHAATSRPLMGMLLRALGQLLQTNWRNNLETTPLKIRIPGGREVEGNIGSFPGPRSRVVHKLLFICVVRRGPRGDPRNSISGSRFSATTLDISVSSTFLPQIQCFGQLAHEKDPPRTILPAQNVRLLASPPASSGVSGATSVTPFPAPYSTPHLHRSLLFTSYNHLIRDEFSNFRYQQTSLGDLPDYARGVLQIKIKPPAGPKNHIDKLKYTPPPERALHRKAQMFEARRPLGERRDAVSDRFSSVVVDVVLLGAEKAGAQRERRDRRRGQECRMKLATWSCATRRSQGSVFLPAGSEHQLIRILCTPPGSDASDGQENAIAAKFLNAPETRVSLKRSQAAGRAGAQEEVRKEGMEKEKAEETERRRHSGKSAKSARCVHQLNHTRTPNVIQSQTHRADARVHEPAFGIPFCIPIRTHRRTFCPFHASDLGIRGTSYEILNYARWSVGCRPTNDPSSRVQTTGQCPPHHCAQLWDSICAVGHRVRDGESGWKEQNAGSELIKHRIDDLCTTRHPISAKEERSVMGPVNWTPLAMNMRRTCPLRVPGTRIVTKS
ncbi:hypothetical protein BJ912DRAFT_935635 [Pholiota molesta]|nr:hypothetical protein BJ912DRAFT_935635 [Pholiota molesta]